MSTSEAVRPPKSGEGNSLAAISGFLFSSRVLEGGLWLLLILAPLPLGSVSDLASALLEGTCFTLLLLAWWFSSPENPRPLPRSHVLLGGLFVFWTLCQILPLPGPVLRAVSPGTHEVYSRNLPGYSAGGKEADLQSWLLSPKKGSGEELQPRPGLGTGYEDRIKVRPAWKPVSWYPGATLGQLSRFLAYAAFFVFVFRYLPERACRTRLPRLLFALGTVLAALGIVQHLFWNGKIYWFINVYQGNPFGPWVNSDHFSGYMEMILPIGVAVLLQTIGWRRTGKRRHARQGGAVWVFLEVCGLTLVGASLILARSRGGLFSLLLVAGLYGAIQIGRRGWRSRHPRLALALAATPLLLVCAGVLWYTLHGGGMLGPSPPRPGMEPSFSSRVHVWQEVLRMVSANPLSGTGLGTFGLAFPLYRGFGNIYGWQQAHNDYLQILAESGVIGFGLLIAGLFSIVRRQLIPIFVEPIQRQDPLVLGAALGIAVLLVHSSVDFNLQIPSNGLLFVLLGALMIRGRGADPEGPGRPGSAPSP